MENMFGATTRPKCVQGLHAVENVPAAVSKMCCQTIPFDKKNCNQLHPGCVGFHFMVKLATAASMKC